MCCVAPLLLLLMILEHSRQAPGHCCAIIMLSAGAFYLQILRIDGERCNQIHGTARQLECMSDHDQASSHVMCWPAVRCVKS